MKKMLILRQRGMVPFLIIGSAGTTNFGTVDPLDR
jgi:glutamate/tyrosine decarboxylase-like PLP-dependent enzyme